MFGCLRTGGRMRIRVIAVEREYGSGGAAIAQALAERLGWKLWDRDLTAEIARVANGMVEALTAI